jgi:hypothetical protein
MLTLFFKIMGGLYGGILGRERVSDYTFSLPSLSHFYAQSPITNLSNLNKKNINYL